MDISMVMLIVVVCLVILLISFMNASGGLYLLIASILISPELKLFEVADRTVAVRLSDLVIIFVFLGWLGRLALRRTPEDFKKSPLTLPIMFFSFVMIFSTLLSISRGTVIPGKSLLYLSKRLQYFLIFFFVLNNVKTLRQVKISLVSFFLSAGIINIVTWYQRSKGELVAWGTFGKAEQANVLGGFFLISLFLSIGLWSAYRGKMKIFLTALIILTIPSILFANSRGSYIAFATALIIVGLWMKKFRLVFVFIIFLFLFLSALPLLPRDLAASVYTSVHVLPGEEDPSWKARLDDWKFYFPQILDYPLLGQGMSAIPLGYVDNQYMMEALDNGLIGLFCLLWLFWRIFISTYSLYKNNNDPYVQGLAFGFLSSFVALLIQALTITNFYTIRTMEPFWFVTGLISVIPLLEMTEKVRPTARNVGVYKF